MNNRVGPATETASAICRSWRAGQLSSSSLSYPVVAVELDVVVLRSLAAADVHNSEGHRLRNENSTSCEPRTRAVD